MTHDLHCAACGYDLHGLPGPDARCPECGQSIQETLAFLKTRAERRRSVLRSVMLIAVGLVLVLCWTGYVQIAGAIVLALGEARTQRAVRGPQHRWRPFVFACLGIACAMLIVAFAGQPPRFHDEWPSRLTILAAVVVAGLALHVWHLLSLAVDMRQYSALAKQTSLAKWPSVLASAGVVFSMKYVSPPGPDRWWEALLGVVFSLVFVWTFAVFGCAVYLGVSDADKQTDAGGA